MLTQIGIEAKKAAAQVAVLSTDKKNQILQSMADELVKNSKKILDANKVDLDNCLLYTSELPTICSV